MYVIISHMNFSQIFQCKEEYGFTHCYVTVAKDFSNGGVVRWNSKYNAFVHVLLEKAEEENEKCRRLLPLPLYPSTARLSPVNDDVNRLFSFPNNFLGFKPCIVKNAIRRLLTLNSYARILSKSKLNNFL